MAKLRPVGDWIADRYEVFAVHAGGMGVVYVAHDHLGPPGRKVVAIKTLREEWLAEDDWAARFAAECQIWVRLGSTGTSSTPTRSRSSTAGRTSSWSW